MKLDEILKLAEARYRLDKHRRIAWCLSADDSERSTPGDGINWQGRVVAIYDGEELRIEYQERYPSGRAPIGAIGGWTNWDKSSRDDDNGHTALKICELITLVEAITNYANGNPLVAA